MPASPPVPGCTAQRPSQAGGWRARAKSRAGRRHRRWSRSVRLPVYCDPTQPPAHCCRLGLASPLSGCHNKCHVDISPSLLFPLARCTARAPIPLDGCSSATLCPEQMETDGEAGSADPLNSTVQKGVSAPTVQLLFVSRRREVLPLHRLAQYSRVKLFLPQRVMNSRIDPFAGRTSRVPAPHTTHTCIKRATTGGGTRCPSIWGLLAWSHLIHSDRKGHVRSTPTQHQTIQTRPPCSAEVLTCTAPSMHSLPYSTSWCGACMHGPACVLVYSASR